MSWSDDTRCLYCEGRLPLYRKITHGQFCSSAHRKAYWQEQEKLAVERLHQTHSSLRSYRSAAQPEVHQELSVETTLHPQLEPVIQAAVANGPALEPDLELDQAPRFDVALYPLPDMGEPPAQASDLLTLLAPDFSGVSGTSPELIAADPFEYEIATQPLRPSVAGAQETRALPEAPAVAVWAYLGPRAVSQKEAAAASRIEGEVDVRHPQSAELAVGIRRAGRVQFALANAVECGRNTTGDGSALQILQMEPAPVTSLELSIAPQSDVLLQLLDEQVPHPDRLHSLTQFAAHQPALAVAYPALRPFDIVPAAELPNAAAHAVCAPYELDLRTDMLQLSGGVPAAAGKLVARATISEIAMNPQPVNSFALPATASAHEMGMARLLRLTSSRSLPKQTAYALQAADSLAFDFSAGVSSDIAYPSMVRVIDASEAPVFTSLLALTFGKKRKSSADAARVEPIAHLIPEGFESQPGIPGSGLQPLDRKPAEDALRAPTGGIGSLVRGEGLKTLVPAWAHATGFWQHAPRDLKLLLFAIPALLALVFHPGWPRVAFAAPQPSAGLAGNFKRVLNTEWGNVRQTLENRAAVALDEDFRSGLDNWASPGGSTTEWSFDPTGFVRPGPLALYRPSVNLTDYHVEFLGLIDKKAMSWVVRAADFENFYVIKLVVLKSGPMPEIGLTRYAVIGGKAQDRHDVKIPLSAREDTVYNVRMDVEGSDFSVEVQGQIADSWTETRLPRGGIGFFTATGEASRLRWMQITHQYDMLGRLCAYLAPYDTTNGSWQP